jgi:hypothetical protein
MNETTKIPTWLNGEEDHPEIWRASDEAHRRCYACPTNWFRRGDCTALQFFGSASGEEVHDAETIYRLISERMAFERDTVIPVAQKYCRRWGVVLLTPEQVRAEEHCQRQGHMRGNWLEPGYAWIQMVNGEYKVWAKESGGKEHYRNLHIFRNFYICNATTGLRMSEKFSEVAKATQTISEWQKLPYYQGITMVVADDRSLPWQVAPAAWAPFEKVQTLGELVKAILEFPGDWSCAERVFSFHSLGERFAACAGIAYEDFNLVEHGVVVNNPKSSRGGTSDLFVWDHTKGLSVKGVSKNGLQWNTEKYTGKVTPRPLYYIRDDKGTIRMSFTRPVDDGLSPVTMTGHNIPEPFVSNGHQSFYGSINPQTRVDEDLNTRWPLLWGFRWVDGSPTPNKEENYFHTLEHTPEQLWLEPCGNGPVKVGDKVRCRERGGFQTVEVKEIASNSKCTWVRGAWSDGDYLPVTEMLYGLGTTEDIAAHRKPGDPGWQGSAS